VNTLAYISLGSNLGDRAANLRCALEYLKQVGNIQKVSGFYEAEPVDVPDQPWFLNCVAALQTTSPPDALLRSILSIEQKMGRVRIRDKGPRLIDIDILLYGNDIIGGAGLKIPHPEMQNRRFVLEPLAEIAPEVVHPILRETARKLLERLPPGQVVRRLPVEKNGS